MRCVEEIAVFIVNKPSKNNKGRFMEAREYMLEELKKSGLKRKEVDDLLGNQMSSHYFTRGGQFSLPSEKHYGRLQETGFWKRSLSDLRKTMVGEAGGEKILTRATYNPQGVRALKKPKIKTEHREGGVYSGVKPKRYEQKATGYPANLIYFENEAKRLHPTQKPLKLIEYLVKTYSDPGDTVLDNCMGSGTTGVACVETGRTFIGMELSDHYFEVSKNRLQEALTKRKRIEDI
ncbi:site-specific DNA-methyltransferase [Clostridiales bacterium]|nr:site-specific DNA-methyltransferase [Clostridiales bacterium]